MLCSKFAEGAGGLLLAKKPPNERSHDSSLRDKDRLGYKLCRRIPVLHQTGAPSLSLLVNGCFIGPSPQTVRPETLSMPPDAWLSKPIEQLLHRSCRNTTS